MHGFEREFYYSPLISPFRLSQLTLIASLRRRLNKLTIPVCEINIKKPDSTNSSEKQDLNYSINNPND